MGDELDWEVGRRSMVMWGECAMGRACPVSNVAGKGGMFAKTSADSWHLVPLVIQDEPNHLL